LRAGDAGSGSPLSEEVRGQLPGAFGDVSDLRVHTDAKAAAASAALNTPAFTVGRDIFFARGAFNPGHTDGRRILAHEVAHGIQQRDSSAGPTSDASFVARAEEDADHAALAGRAPRLKVGRRQVMAFPDQPATTKAQQLFKEYMASGEYYYDRLEFIQTFTQELLGLISVGEIDPVIQVLNLLAADSEVGDRERRTLSRGIIDGLPPESLDELAGSDVGRNLFTALSNPLQRGGSYGLRGLVLIEDALARTRGHVAAEGVLSEARERVKDAPEAQTLSPLDPLDIEGGLRRIRVMLSMLHQRYDDDIEVGPAIAEVEADLEGRFKIKPGQEIDLDDDARQLGAAATIVTRFTAAMDKFDRMVPGSRPAADSDPLALHFLEIIGGVRRDWIAALGNALMEEGPTLLAVAESKSAALPDALLQLYLASVPAHGALFNFVPENAIEMLAWVRWTQDKIIALRQEANEPQTADVAGPSLEAREKRRRRDSQLIALSLEGIKLWDRAIRAHEETHLGISPIGQLLPHVWAARGSLERIGQRCAAMKAAALSEDLDTLSSLAKRNREDPDIEQFFKAMPGFIESANVLPGMVGHILVQFTILKFASMASAAAGSLISAGEGASLLNVSAQVGLEALVFTGTSRTMQAAVGQPSKDSFLLDLALNIGLFGAFRFTGAAVRATLTSRGLEAYAGEATQIASFPVLQAHGALHFRITQGRWPTGQEIGEMSIDSLIWYAALVKGRVARPVSPKAHSGLAVLDMLHAKYGERLESFETAKTELGNRIYEQLQAEDPAAQKKLEDQAKALEGALTSLFAEIKADPQFEAQLLSNTLQDPALQDSALQSNQTSTELAESFGAPVEAGLVPSGEAQYSYAPGATEEVMEALEGKNAVVSDTIDAKGQHTLVAETPGEPPVFLSERAPRAPVRRYVPSPPAPAPKPPRAKPRAPDTGPIFAPEGGLTKYGVTQVRSLRGNANLTVDEANLKAASHPGVLEHLVREHYRRAINRGEIRGRFVSGYKMNIRRFAEALPGRAANAPAFNEATRDFINRPENAALRNQLINRLSQLRDALGMPQANLNDAAIDGDPWEAAGRLRDKAQATLGEMHPLRRAAEDYASMFARSIGDLQPDMMIVEQGSFTVIDATHTVGTQFEVFHEFKTMLYKRIMESIWGLPGTGIEFRSPREQRTI
jgi:hypothetical protein